jgi:hypothetical protein
MPSIGIKAAIDNCPQGARFAEGWVFIRNARGDQQGIDFDVDFYASLISFQNGYQPLCTKKLSIPYQSGDLIQILYAYLLSLSIDETGNSNPSARIKCNLSEGIIVTIPDPVLPVGDASQE